MEINQRFIELFGFSLKEIKGRSIDNLIIHTPDMSKKGKELTKRVLEKAFYHEATRKRKDGTLFPVSIFVLLLLLMARKGAF